MLQFVNSKCNIIKVIVNTNYYKLLQTMNQINEEFKFQLLKMQEQYFMDSDILIYIAIDQINVQVKLFNAIVAMLQIRDHIQIKVNYQYL